jgi:hypothetical protein
MHWHDWTVVVEYHTGVLNFWAGANKYDIRYHPDSNSGNNLEPRNIWSEFVAALLNLTRNCNRWRYIYINKYGYIYKLVETHELSWHRLYKMQSVWCNRDVQLHCFRRNYWTLKGHRIIMLCKELTIHLTNPNRIPRRYMSEGQCCVTLQGALSWRVK